MGARGLREERGMTLPELLIAITIGLVVLGAAVTVFSTAARSQPRVSERAGDIQRARTVIEQITRELRQGSMVTTASATQLSILTYVDKGSCGGATATTAIQCLVDYTCTAGACTRTERNPDGTGTAAGVQVVAGLASTNVFSYSPSEAAPGFVRVELSFPAGDGEDSISLGDGAALRNMVEAG
jgi:prepilin-type N-terminal cleavage/methylation domain-containing protein